MARRCLRLAALALAAGIAGLLAVPAAAANPGAARQHPWIAITSVSPRYAQPSGKVTVSGIVTNPGGSPLRGLSVELWSSAIPLTSSEMASYLTAPEPTGVDYLIPGEQRNLPPVPAHGAEQWAMTLTASQLGMHTFGVYPLAAHLIGAGAAPGIVGAPLDYARSFLPFWPGKPASKSVHPVNIAWVWPLIDTPQQTMCGTLTSNELAANVASGGRLNSLLAAGQTATARQALLTWAIDPALLSDVSAMSGPYRVTGTGSCYAGKQEPLSSAASKWLAGVQQVAAHQDFFTTPYADVDVAALAHAGLDPELTAAFADGRRAAGQAKIPGTQTKILGQPQRVTPSTGGGYIAWPAGGIADYGVLEALARNQIKTVILNSSFVHTPATVTTVPNGQGGELTVLRANDVLTQILSIRRDQIPGLVPAGYATPSGARTQARNAAAFAKEQWFLAETAMVAAQAPAAGRSIVVAPPRHWNPLPGMASALLGESTGAPWLRPASLASLAGTASTGSGAGQLNPPGRHASSSELSASLLGQVRQLDQKIQLLDSILTRPGHGYLSTAVDTVESSAWRGRKANERPAQRLVRSDLAYVLGRLEQVKIVGSLRVTLGGENGVVPVSISNGLDQAVTVKLVASTPPADHVTLGKFTSLVTVKGHTQRTIKIPVTEAQAGSTTLTLHLTTKYGKRLPVAPSSLIVVATHFGTLAIVIISIALVVFVLTATARAIRRGPQDDGSAAEAEELDPMPGTSDRASADEEPDSVVSRVADDGQAAKEADEHASTPGPADRG